MMYFIHYSRIKPGCKPELAEIEAEIKCKLEEVCWLPDFCHLPPDVRIASTKAYQEGKVKTRILSSSYFWETRYFISEFIVVVIVFLFI